MKQKWIIVIVFLLMAFGVVIAYQNQKSDLSYDYSDAFEDEKESINHFNENEKMVIKGESFDVRCLYYDDKDIENSVWQLVKKGNPEMELNMIEIGNQNGSEFMYLKSNPATKAPTYTTSAPIIGYFGYEKDYIYLCNFPTIGLIYVGTADFLQDRKNEVRDKLTVKLYYNDTTEEFNMNVNINDQYEVLRKMNEARINGAYEQNPQLKKLSYLYYAALYRVDFDAWCQEISTLLDNGGFPDALFFSDANMVHRAFHLSYYREDSIDEGRLRAILDLNDVQYKKYKNIVKKAYEKGVFTEVLSFLLK